MLRVGGSTSGLQCEVGEAFVAVVDLNICEVIHAPLCDSSKRYRLLPMYVHSKWSMLPQEKGIFIEILKR